MRRFFFGAAATLCAFAACAKAVIDTTPEGGVDATTEASACPYDTTKDPQHCGSCNNACEAGLVCSSSKCSSTCDSPTTKCITDAGQICATLVSDPQHCGQCTTACGLADAGSMAPGTNNPDAGIAFDGGYDGGSGWSLGAPTCEGGTCNVTCPSGMTKCSDGICYDLLNHHDHCGACSTACGPNEWCNNGGHCCGQGQEYCGSACANVLTDPNNCGGCGVTCSGQTPYCANGACTKGCVPTGTRQAFNTLSSSTVTGCWTGNPCGTDTYSFNSTNGVNYQNAGENIVCGGTTACVGNVGITTYSSSAYCQGVWDIYCDNTKVGTINTVGKTCTGSAMTSGCSTTFTPMSCSNIKIQLSAGAGTILCCSTSGTNPDSMLVGVSAW